MLDVSSSSLCNKRLNNKVKDIPGSAGFPTNCVFVWNLLQSVDLMEPMTFTMRTATKNKEFYQNAYAFLLLV
jgi:hypothetical protein